MDYLYYGFVILVFLAVAGFIEGAYLTWNAYRGPEAKRIEHRLQAMSAGAKTVDAPLLKQRLLSDAPAIERLLLAVPRLHLLDRLLVQSGSSMNLASLLGVALALALAAAGGAHFLGLPLWFVGAAAALGAFLPFAYLLRLRQQRMNSIESQLPDALELMARAMQAGHAFSSALHMVGTEGPQPIAQEFRTTFDEINFGLSVQDALLNLAARAHSQDLRYFVVAVLVQRETGGNLAELLTSIAALMRERMKLKGAVRVLSAEGRLSAWILTILPFVLAAVISFINPRFVGLLWTDPIGIQMAGAALVLMALGIFWLWRIISVRI
ncbi:MAG: type II secretion system F family protein [Betaproteobacteria bacterium]|nr:MAG: type II secretion system F family protein [Betaproteobacteria bacterium]